MSRPNYCTRQQLRFWFSLVLALSIVTIPVIPASRATGASASLPSTASLVPRTRAATSSESTAAANEDAAAQAHEAYGKLSLQFEANQGQTDSRVNFITRAADATAFLTPTAAVFVLSAPNETGGLAKMKTTGSAAQESTATPRKRWALRMNIEGANPEAQVTGQDQLPGIVNYFIGNDTEKWHTNIPTFARVQYANIYPGVDLVYYGNQRQLEYDFVVQPSADSSRIALNFEGANSLALDANGDLLIKTGVGDLRQHKPAVYQEADGIRQEIDSGYEIKGGGRVGFRVGAYDASKPLIIDPVLVYSTDLGGGGGDVGYGIAVDSLGNAYITGQTGSTDFPTTPGTFDTTLNGSTDVLVTKLNASGTTLVYSTYLGGNSQEYGFGIAVDSSGNAYVTGQTFSTNFPTTPGAFDTTLNGSIDAFVTKLNASGAALVYSTYLGGNNNDNGNGIAVDSAGNAYVTGGTHSTDFPTTPGAFDPIKSPDSVVSDIFVTKLNTSGAVLAYSTYLGGNGDDFGSGIAVDSAGNAYVTGGTVSTNFPTTPGAFQGLNFGGQHAFVTKFNASGAALVYSTYLGGNGLDSGQAIAADSAGNAYVTGGTSSTNFPTTFGAVDDTDNPGTDAFVTKLNASGAALVYSTYLGGNSNDNGFGVAVDSSGNACVTGETSSTNFPTTPAAFDTTFNGSNDVFVTKLNAAGTALVYSTYLGGDVGDGGTAVAVDSAGNTYITGHTVSTNFPTTADAFQTAGGGGYQVAFVAKIGDYAISGRVINSSGNGILGVTITLSGSRSDSTTTDANGNFLFLNTTPAGSFTVTPFKSGFTFSPESITINNLNSNQDLLFIGTAGAPTPTPTPAQMRVQFEFANYIAAEECASIQVAVTRTGDTTSALTIDFATADDTAKQKSDYEITLGTLTFNAGETRKTITVLITEDAYVEGDETFTLNLFNLRGAATLEEPSRATITIADDDTTATTVNPIDNSQIFVCQHYHDFLGREPDAAGLLAWLNVLNNCASGDTHCDRVAVSADFFGSPEFKDKGYYTIRFYFAALGRNPAYQEFMQDLTGLNGATSAETEAARTAFANVFVQRAEFKAIYDPLTNAQYMDRILQTADITITNRDQLVNDLNSNTKTRAQVLREIVETTQMFQKSFNRGFVLMQYLGYLRRDPEAAGFQMWLNYLNTHPTDFRTMVRGFVDSVEYRMRFGQP